MGKTNRPPTQPHKSKDGRLIVYYQILRIFFVYFSTLSYHLLFSVFLNILNSKFSNIFKRIVNRYIDIQK